MTTPAKWIESPSVLDLLATLAPVAPARDPGPPSASSGAGSRYGHLRELARGGMGSILLVHDRDLDRQVVMKMLAPELLRRPAFNELVVREARSAGKLQHPNIVPVLDLGMNERGELYFTMPYVQGDTLGELIQRLASGDPETHARYGFTQRLHIILKICEALAHAHSFAILHRDLKPSNVMIGQFGEVLVMDWGLAFSLTMDEPQEGQVVGTPGYMAPEQARGENALLTARTDVYGIGALMYHLFALKPPYQDLMPSGEPKTIQTTRPVIPERVRVKGQLPIPREISRIIERAMEEDPLKRFPTVEALSGEIIRYLDGQAPVVCIHTGFKRTLRWIGNVIDKHGPYAMFVVVMVTVLPWVLVLVALFC